MNAPALSVLEVVYELLMIGWFGWLGIAMLRSAGHSQQRVIAPRSRSGPRRRAEAWRIDRR